ncbi:MAG: DEAD/DEAH box helicase [Planctomycetota bacterium JB042]
MSTAEEPLPIFTGEDRLRLLQLQTRRAMHERRERSASDRRGGGSGPSSDDSSTAVPDQWRLLPEDCSLYGWQQECLTKWMRQGRGTVKVATGGGKTLFALAAAERLQNEREADLRLVVVVPTIPLMFQWCEELRQGNVPSAAIGLMGGGQDLPPLDRVRILICVLNSARERLPGLVKKQKWADRMLLVVDECHRARAKQARRIFDAHPKYTLGLSATPEQDEGEEGVAADEAYESGVVGKALGPIIYDFTIRQSLEAGLLTQFEVWHVGLMLSPEEAGVHARLSREISDLRKSLQAGHRRSRSRQPFLAWCQTQASRGGAASANAERFNTLANRRKRLLYRARARVDVAVAILSETVADEAGRAILFHESIDEIETLFLEAEERGIPCVLEHSQLPDGLRAENIEAFRQGVARAIISAKSLVEGFNVPSADLGIIAASSSSVRQRIQSLGRMLRRKTGGRQARIVVLYVRDTEDEAIYEKADWEDVIGAERNRYFHWVPSGEAGQWPDDLEEISSPPRRYRPPSWDVEVESLGVGDPYPAQSLGLDLRVDTSGNLRSEEGGLVDAPRSLVEAILERNAHRRARRTPAGHLIVRVDSAGSGEPDWRFLGTVDEPEAPDAHEAVRLKVMTVSGRRVFGREEGRKKGTVSFALGPDKAKSPEGGRARDLLLRWVKSVEEERGVEVRELLWDGDGAYWLELEGERIPYEERLAPLEFRS